MLTSVGVGGYWVDHDNDWLVFMTANKYVSVSLTVQPDLVNTRQAGGNTVQNFLGKSNVESDLSS